MTELTVTEQLVADMLKKLEPHIEVNIGQHTNKPTMQVSVALKKPENKGPKSRKKW